MSRRDWIGGGNGRAARDYVTECPRWFAMCGLILVFIASGVQL